MRFNQTLSLFVAAMLTSAAIAADRVTAQVQDHQYTSADIEAGSRLYAAQCTLCHGPNGDAVSGINLRRGTFRRPMSDDDLKRAITVGNTSAGMPPFALDPPELDRLVAFIRAGFDTTGMPVRIGNAARGKLVYDGKGGCARCHRINGVGSRVAPDLSDIGSVRQAPALQRTLLDPTRGMLPINRPLRAVTRDGRTIRGRRLNEDTFTVQVIDEQERLVSLVKADLREYELATSSTMPSVSGVLTPDEVADLVAYLLSLKGQP